MRHLLLAATALFPLAALAATYTIIAPGTTPGVGQFASLGALAQAQKDAPFLKPGDVVMLPDGALAPDDQGQFYNIGAPGNPVTFRSAGYTYLPNVTGDNNDKGTLTFYSSDVAVQNLVFAGNHLCGSTNCAGIRMSVNYGLVDANAQAYPYNLTVKNSGFFMNGDGILADDCSISPLLSGQYIPPGVKPNTNGTCSVAIDGSTFAGNGAGDGLTHSVYIDRVDQLTVTNSLFTGSFDGHLIKSRAFSSDIENNRLFDGPFGMSNNLIDIPVGGNLTVKGNVMEHGPLGRQTFISYNEENWPPTLNNPGGTVVIDGNTIIDDWTAAHAPYTAFLLQDGSQWPANSGAPGTHMPTPANESVKVTNNRFFSPGMTAGNLFQFAPATDVAGAGNTFAASGAPALDMTSPIAWPAGATMRTLTVQANGFELGLDGTHNDASTDPAAWPQLILWWNGYPLTPAPVQVKADASATPPGSQAVTYQVPVIPGAPQFMAAFSVNPGCCLNGTQQGRDLNLLSATLGGGAPIANPPLSGTVDAVFPAGSVQPPVDTTPPVLAPPAALTLAAGSSAPLVLSATDPDNTPAQLAYTVTAAPAHGTIAVGGAAASAWTQADLAAGRVTYTAGGTAAATDGIGFTVADPAGNTVSGTLAITIKAAPPPPPPMPAPIVLAPGVQLLPAPNGTWHWK